MSGRLKTLIAWLALAALMAACAASPRFQTVKRYVPAEGATAEVCLEKCAAAMEPCQRDCEMRYQSCARSVLPDAQTRYADLLRQHEAALAQYRWELERYRLDMMMGWGYDPFWGVWGWYPPFPPPPPPSVPSLEQETARLTSERCDRDCGCQSAYDSCFLACGGTIEHESQCIANCPPAKPQSSKP
jgi:hypothetical protein